MYSAFRQFCERLLRIPPHPEPPPGDETKTKVFLAAPNFYRYLLALWALKTLVAVWIFFVVSIGPLIALFAGHSRKHGNWAVPLLIIEGLFAILVLFSTVFRLALVKLDFDKRWYVVTDRSLRVREGIWQVREATVTFANIQNISISQGPIQRALGIADLRVDTAGGGGSQHSQRGMPNMHVVWFRGVVNANEIRELMQQRLRHLKDSGLGDNEEMIPQRTTTPDASFIDALREVANEAAALRAAASRRAKSV
jgi:membrane protein YdbS with pleckstrin-like domain